MRIVIDLQGAQGENSKRGIGRYSLSLALALARQRQNHEIFIALNGMLPEAIEEIRVAFLGLIPSENIRVWDAAPPSSHIETTNDWRRAAAEVTREAFLASLKPDVVLISSLFEGLVDNATTSIGRLHTQHKTAVVLYDLIPLIHPTPYLENPKVAVWYREKIEHLKHAHAWLSISESSRQEGMTYLGFPEEASFNVGTDADPQFQQLAIEPTREQDVRAKYGLNKSFVMYTGGIDFRKNVEGLIRSYSRLPQELRRAHQLAIVCHAQPESRLALKTLATSCGLGTDELVLTGFVPEDDLICLYNICRLFIFPSWHEGFGLPALEAMRCGAPVIGSNLSSLPEVIGWEEALFDPHSDDAIAKAILRGLTDQTYRNKLINHGRMQATRFSWDACALAAISAMERLCDESLGDPYVMQETQRPRLAYISPLPPERSGISDYSAELLPALAVHYEIDVITTQEAIGDAWITEHCAVRSVAWFEKNYRQFDRVLYHFGNSAFHQHMFELLENVPGVVVLHDFFLSGIVAHMDFQGISPGLWNRALYQSHGYPALRDRLLGQNVADAIWKYPCNLDVIQNSIGMIVHSENSLRLCQEWYGSAPTDWCVIPHMRDPHVALTKTEARAALNLPESQFIVCAFGILGQSKLNHRLIEAWLKSRLARDPMCQLVFVGENPPGDYADQLLSLISQSGSQANIHITGWADTHSFRNYLCAADVGVQLRTLSRGETSGTVLDCMNHGLPTIINANGSMADIDDNAVIKLPDDFTDEQLQNALEAVWSDFNLRKAKGDYARNLILQNHNPAACANQYKAAIEHFYLNAAANFAALPEQISMISGQPSSMDLANLSSALAKSFQPLVRKSQLLVDVSELVVRDAKTGIQRLVRSIIKHWLDYQNPDYRIELVYTRPESSTYYYARHFTLDFLGCPKYSLEDEPIDFGVGDIFFALDLQPSSQVKHKAFFRMLRQRGVQVKFMVYDLLCINARQYFPTGAADAFTAWLKVVAESDAAICISRAVSNELSEWIEKNSVPQTHPFSNQWFHLGSDMESSKPTTGIPKSADLVLDALRSRTNFLMVGTLEPRKGHEQVLMAFEQLWKDGIDVSLTIVGKKGWLTEALVKRLKAHPEQNVRLFWLDSASDEYLAQIYAASDCLIAASYGEGFGLPLIEAARYGLPLLIRDIPVFREVAENNATYFSANTPFELSQAISNWLNAKSAGHCIESQGIKHCSWEQSAQKLYAIVTNSSLCIN